MMISYCSGMQPARNQLNRRRAVNQSGAAGSSPNIPGPLPGLSLHGGMLFKLKQTSFTSRQIPLEPVSIKQTMRGQAQTDIDSKMIGGLRCSWDLKLEGRTTYVNHLIEIL